MSELARMAQEARRQYEAGQTEEGGFAPEPEEKVMRDIKFRGKVDGVWWHVNPEHNLHRWSQFWEMVSPETVGQYTGLKDRAGKEIYEGDIVLLEGRSTAYVDYGIACFRFVSSHDGYKMALEDLSHLHMEVIGNIHENPDLLSQQ